MNNEPTELLPPVCKYCGQPKAIHSKLTMSCPIVPRYRPKHSPSPIYRNPVQIVQGFIDCQLEAGNSSKHQLLCNVRDKIKEECMTNELNLNCTNCGEYAGSDIADEIERLREALLVAELVMRAAFADPESLIYSELSTNCFASALEIVTAALKGQDHAKLHTDGG